MLECEGVREEAFCYRLQTLSPPQKKKKSSFSVTILSLDLAANELFPLKMLFLWSSTLLCAHTFVFIWEGGGLIWQILNRQWDTKTSFSQDIIPFNFINLIFTHKKKKNRSFITGLQISRMIWSYRFSPDNYRGRMSLKPVVIWISKKRLIFQ